MSDLIPEDDGRRPFADDLQRAGCQLDDVQRVELEKAMQAIHDIAGDWCDCDCMDGRKCSNCLARESLQRIERVLYPVVRSLREDRMQGAERVYVLNWIKENTRRRGINHGTGLLEVLMSDDDNPVPISQRDMDVATTVVQWLGTNCGMSFLRECERDITSMREARTQLLSDQREVTNNPDSLSYMPEILQMALTIAEDHASTESDRHTLYRKLQALISAAQESREERLAKWADDVGDHEKAKELRARARGSDS